MSAPSKARLLEVAKIQAKIFHNMTPTATPQRTGAKILKRPLKGDTIASYYGPKDFITTKQLNSRFPMYKFVDPEEEYRLDVLGTRKRRGKGAPAKKREKADESGKKKKK
jgi:small subunit ribosomal protein S33